MKTTNKIKVSYRFKGKNLVSIHTTTDKSFIPDCVEICEEEIEQYIRESILDQCVGWEKAQEKEHKALADFKNNKIIQITNNYTR